METCAWIHSLTLRCALVIPLASNARDHSPSWKICFTASATTCTHSQVSKTPANLLDRFSMYKWRKRALNDRNTIMSKGCNSQVSLAGTKHSQMPRAAALLAMSIEMWHLAQSSTKMICRCVLVCFRASLNVLSKSFISLCDTHPDSSFQTCMRPRLAELRSAAITFLVSLCLLPINT